MNEEKCGECVVIGNTSMAKENPPLKDTTKLVGIYGLKNKVNGKWYIGKSTDIIGRWNNYRLLRCKEQPKIYNALKKYGYDSFDKIVIELCENSERKLLDEKEISWIKFYRAFTNGYNLTIGGDGFSHTEETREKIKRSLTGKTHSTERRKNQSVAQKMRAELETSIGTRKCFLGMKNKKERYLNYITPIINEITINKKLSCVEIAKELNNRKILSPRGFGWNKYNVIYLFKSYSLLK